LEREKRRRGRSLNQTVIDLLGQSLGVEKSRSNGLGRLAGSWSEGDFREFEHAVAPFEQIDEELWR
jgi:kynureninase